MAQEDPSYEASESDQLPDAHTGTQAYSSQPDFVQPLEDSQETSQNDVGEHSASQQHHQNPHPIQQTSNSYFFRPTIETTEEIAASFQFHTPPSTRNVFHNSNGPQKNPTLQSMPNARNTYEPAEHGKRPELLRPTTFKNDVRDPRVESQVSDAAEVAVESHRTPKTTVHTTEHVDKSDSISSENTPNLPFPDETQSPRSNRKKNRHSHFPLANAQFPKSIADTRQKALAQLSPRPRAPSAKSPLSSSATVRRPVPRAHERIRKEASIERTQPSCVSVSSETLDGIPENYHAEDVEHTSKKHRQAKRQKVQGLTRPIPGKALDDEVVTTTRPRSQASNVSKQRAPRGRHHQRGSPTREQNGINLKKFAESWNTNYLYNQQLLDRWEQKIAMLDKHIEDQNSTIEQYHRDIESRDETINALSKEIEEQQTQSQAVHDEIIASSTLRKKLEEKLRSCRARLNDAVNEQQQLFLRCRERFQETTAKVKEESQAQKESIEKATTTVELLRAEIKQEVIAVTNDANAQVTECELDKST